MVSGTPPQPVATTKSNASQLASSILRELQAVANPTYARQYQRFFKTSAGGYASFDRFLGVPVPLQRRIAKNYTFVPHATLRFLLAQPWHEARYLALILLTHQFSEATKHTNQRVRKYLHDSHVSFYLRYRKHVNNWDLVDISAPAILGSYCCFYPQKQKLLKDLFAKPSMWEQRIALVATLPLIRQGQLTLTFSFTTQLLSSREELLHKAAGWMLREIGKQSKPMLVQYLNQYAFQMPRIMLRYAIEHFSAAERTAYLQR